MRTWSVCILLMETNNRNYKSRNQNRSRSRIQLPIQTMSIPGIESQDMKSLRLIIAKVSAYVKGWQQNPPARSQEDAITSTKNYSALQTALGR